MEFTAHRDIDAPLDHVFDAASDFATFERQALSRGIDVTRKSAIGVMGSGTAWTIAFDLRGSRRVLEARVTAWDPPSGFTIAGTTDGFDMALVVNLIPLSRSVTRLAPHLSLTPRGMKARALIQPLKLARGTVQDRIDARLAAFGETVEQRYRALS